MTDALQPVPEERPALVPPPRVPPVLRGLVPPPGGGGFGSYRRPSWLWLRFVALTLVVLGAGSLALLVWLVPQRAPAFSIAAVFVALQVYRRRRLFRSPQFDLLPAKIYIGAISGGAVGELIGQVVFHISPGAPTGVLWLAAGAVGIGGACGVAFGALTTIAVGGLVGGVMLWRTLG